MSKYFFGPDVKKFSFIKVQKIFTKNGNNSSSLHKPAIEDRLLCD